MTVHAVADPAAGIVPAVAMVDAVAAIVAVAVDPVAADHAAVAVAADHAAVAVAADHAAAVVANRKFKILSGRLPLGAGFFLPIASGKRTIPFD